MKILVLGNGFDLDHDLPTSYSDFLNFCNFALDMDNPNSPYLKKLKDSQIKYIEILKNHSKIKSTFLSFIKDNQLLNYFNKKIQQGANWIDFEQEIKNIVREFKAIETELKQSNQYVISTNNTHKVHQVLKDLGLKNIDNNIWNETNLLAIHSSLCHYFNNFSLALEYYISTFINETPVEGVSPDIIDFNANKVITFNYSNTYERVYGGVRWDESIDYVHGMALGNLDKEPNIILGITSTEDNNQISYVEFEKYYQRITKKTGNDYKKWLQPKKELKEKIEVAFFGHSLDSSDSDIINDLICNENSVTTIYYHDEIAHQQIVANLIDIIGKDNLIKFVSGENPKVTFINQRLHQQNNNAGLEITRDIRNLYNLHLCSKEEIENLLNKLETKIKSREQTYFHSQRKTIDLFEALRCQEIDFANVKDFINICQLLNLETSKNMQLIYYYKEEWYHQTPWDEVSCDKKTEELIDAVNVSNKKRFQETRFEKPFANISKMKTSEEIENALLEIFNEEPSKSYWKQLDELMSSLLDNKIFAEAINQFSNKKYPIEIRCKAKYFAMIYNEMFYDFNLAKEWNDNERNNNYDN